MIQTTGKWYVIRVAGNKEKSMSDKIRSELSVNKLHNSVHNIIVPVVKRRNYGVAGRKKYTFLIISVIENQHQ